MAAREIVERSIQRYFRAINTEDWTDLREVFASDGTYQNAGSRIHTGGAEVVEFFARIFADTWATHRDDPVNTILEGDQAAVEVSFTGLTRDGHSLVFPAVDVFKFDVDGRISELRTWYDLVEVRRSMTGAES